MPSLSILPIELFELLRMVPSLSTWPIELFELLRTVPSLSILPTELLELLRTVPSLSILPTELFDELRIVPSDVDRADRRVGRVADRDRAEVDVGEREVCGGEQHRQCNDPFHARNLHDVGQATTSICAMIRTLRHLCAAARGILSKRRVLAISNDLEQLRRIVATLERAGAEVDAVRSPEAIAGDVIPHRYVFYSATAGTSTRSQPLVPKLRDNAHVTIVTPRRRRCRI